MPLVAIGGVRFKRGKIINKVARLDPEGIQYEGFTYFPRFPGEKDPPYEPSKLFMITRVLSLRRLPYWEKYIMERHLRLGRTNDTCIVKNTPKMNAMLYKVKHVIKITPITFPYGMPDDPSKGYLDDHGRFISYNLLNSVPLEEAVEETKQLREKSVDSETLKRRLNLKWYQRWD